MSTPQTATEIAANDVALIGVACRFPGASNTEEFWELLKDGREARTELSDADLRAAGVPDLQLSNPDYVKAGMFLPHMEQFDPGFFGLSPLDGRVMDPQHRQFLECAWEALEDAGCDPVRYAGAIGVFAGSGHNLYLASNLLTNPDLLAEVGFFLLRHTGNDKDFLATRASYCFDLKGPSVNIQTACSTSLVAIHAAAQSLLSGECDIALAGGVTIELPHRHGYLFKESEILSRDGHCRPFDASAGGTVFGSGVGVAVLKRLDTALADGDHIYGVLKASAVNNDGAGKVSYLAPSVDGQTAAIREALAIGGIDPQTVTYIETHGTGTQLGDPIEVAALLQAYGAAAGGRNRCGIGSVKSNVGHLDTAAGIASVFKVLLAMQHRHLPATLHYTAPNPAINFQDSPFYVNQSLQHWKSHGPLRAGVSSLGVGGTNAHLILEEAPRREATGPGRRKELLVLSARSETSVLRFRDRLTRYFESHANDDASSLADAAFTLAVGRKAFRKRAWLLVDSSNGAVAALDQSARESLVIHDAATSECKVAFMFAGGGAQYPGMGRDLYEAETVYRDAVDECLALFREFIDFDLRALMFPDGPDAMQAASAALERPSRTLPALFATQYAQARLWQSWGIEPAAMIGHSMGENTAACIAGVLSLRDALGLVALRGRLFETVGAGLMLGVELGEDDLRPLLGTELSLAAANAPGLSVASGPIAAIATLEQQLASRGVGCRRVRIEVAAHSSMLESILVPFGDYLRSIRLQAPSVPFVSNLTGDWITVAEATDPDYWVRHLRNTVRFSQGVQLLLQAQEFALLEVGPGRTLASLAGMHPAKSANSTLVNSMRQADEKTDDLGHMLGSLGRLWARGVVVGWRKFYGAQNRRLVPLPTYAFDHVRCWVEPGSGLGAGRARLPDGSRRAVSAEQMLYQPAWQPTALLRSRSLESARILLVGGGHRLTSLLADVMSAQAAEVRVVTAGKTNDWAQLLDSLEKSGWQPTHIVHALALDLPAGTDAGAGHRALAFDSLFLLAQCAANQDWQRLSWTVLTPQAVSVGAERVRSPLGALALGPVSVLPHENPGWRWRMIDVEAVESGGLPPARLADQIWAEISDESPPARAPDIVALRGAGRFVRRFVRFAGQPSQYGLDTAVRDRGVYLITGGTGGLGLAAARMLASQPAVTLILLARHALPERQYWQSLVDAGSPDAALLETLLELESRGATVRLETGDVTDATRMRELAASVRKEFDVLHGILHTAGVLQDALLTDKDLEQALRVLAPKVSGTLVLADAFGDLLQDWFVAYSSTSAFIGLPGQIDYAAANAFMDAYASSAREVRWRFVAVNWPVWREVGMAATAARGGKAPRLPAGVPTAHPLLQRRCEQSATMREYATLFDVAKFWMLHEHRLTNGAALIPGSGFMEIARAAFQEGGDPQQAMEFEAVSFEFPFVVGDRQSRLLRAQLALRPDGADFKLLSEQFGEQVTHVAGTARSRPFVAERLDIGAIRGRCNRGAQSFSDPEHHPFMNFGSRWESLRGVHVGSGEALIELALDAALADELEVYRLHPALLDMATAGAQVIIDNYVPMEDFYVPIGYRRLHFSGRLPEKCVSHVVLRPSGGPHQHDVVIFDVRIADLQGAVCLIAEGFSMRRLPDPAAFRRSAEVIEAIEPPSLKRTLALGIDAADGLAALAEILRSGVPGQILVSPYQPDHLQAELLAAALPKAVLAAPRHDPDADPVIPAVEKILGGCRMVDKVVVRSFLDGNEETRLVAYFLPHFAAYTTLGAVRNFARQNLPADRIPQQFVEIDTLDVGADGLIVRTSQRDPLAPIDKYSAPRTSTEKLLARIWQDALGVDRVGLADNFFDLGGHSLISTRVIIQAQKRLGVRLDQATMVLNTLEQISKDIDTRVAAAGVAAPTAANKPADNRRGLLASIFGQRSGGAQ